MDAFTDDEEYSVFILKITEDDSTHEDVEFVTDPKFQRASSRRCMTPFSTGISAVVMLALAPLSEITNVPLSSWENVYAVPDAGT